MVLALALGEIQEFWAYYVNPEQLLAEQIVELRYQLRYKLLHHAAFQGVLSYNPRDFLARLTHRLYTLYDEEHQVHRRLRVSPVHVGRLNRLGVQLVGLHSTLISLKQSGFKVAQPLGGGEQPSTDDAQRQASLAVIQIFDRVRQLHTRSAHLAEIERTVRALRGV
jgi:hypothetical protein